jgi:hypothetical protein
MIGKISSLNSLRIWQDKKPVEDAKPVENVCTEQSNGAVLKIIEIIAEKAAADAGTTKDAEVLKLARSIRDKDGFIFGKNAFPLLAVYKELLISRLGQKTYDDYANWLATDMSWPYYVVRSNDIAFALNLCPGEKPTGHPGKNPNELIYRFCKAQDGDDVPIAYPRPAEKK